MDEKDVYTFIMERNEKFMLAEDRKVEKIFGWWKFFGEKVKKGGYIENSRSTADGRNTMAGKWEN